eukprot:CAMPEP_0184319210 /NCGR_PEP_ID=MMETSP1049-20130417/107100_1 /TAXON_ID=77928 /ORGANISM="Proteomonas sulcata, Strain CCMP704" /LENGTH=415 /DNA_ID=CAMNT_0026639263 /DNA_START=65 /DNA_END=1310 /DNA_ORIENTATION=+
MMGNAADVVRDWGRNRLFPDTTEPAGQKLSDAVQPMKVSGLRMRGNSLYFRQSSHSMGSTPAKYQVWCLRRKLWDAKIAEFLFWSVGAISTPLGMEKCLSLLRMCGLAWCLWDGLGKVDPEIASQDDLKDYDFGWDDVDRKNGDKGAPGRSGDGGSGGQRGGQSGGSKEKRQARGSPSPEATSPQMRLGSYGAGSMGDDEDDRGQGTRDSRVDASGSGLSDGGVDTSGMGDVGYSGDAGLSGDEDETASGTSGETAATASTAATAATAATTASFATTATAATFLSAYSAVSAASQQAAPSPHHMPPPVPLYHSDGADLSEIADLTDTNDMEEAASADGATLQHPQPPMEAVQGAPEGERGNMEVDRLYHPEFRPHGTQVGMRQEAKGLVGAEPPVGRAPPQGSEESHRNYPVGLW